MKTRIEDFNKSKPFLVCIDNDGCAMDTMESKHRKSFGPMAVATWDELKPIEKEFLEVWNKLNLYASTRGINRFKGIIEAFKEMERRGYQVPACDALSQWAEETGELSARSLEEAHKLSPHSQYEKALEWSRKVNGSIAANADEDKPFAYVLESLKSLSGNADIAIVSSANSEAIIHEWTKHGLSEYVDVLCGQESGTKAECIRKLKEGRGYARHEVLMIGDALGDLEAAEENDALFYPIIPQKEDASWERFFREGQQKFLGGSYAGAFADGLLAAFKQALEG